LILKTETGSSPNAANAIIIGRGRDFWPLPLRRRVTILIPERGSTAPSAQDRDATAIFGDGAARMKIAGRTTRRSIRYYHVGGNPKFYGAAPPRSGIADFDVIEHRGGKTPGWADLLR
jgi:hypothetical protein